MSKTGLQTVISQEQGRSLEPSEAPSPAQGPVPGRYREARAREREKNRGRETEKMPHSFCSSSLSNLLHQGLQEELPSNLETRKRIE